MADSGRISADIGIERRERLQRLADTQYNGILKRAIIAAVDLMLEEEALQRASIPLQLTEAINYIRLIMHTGTPEQDWALLQLEVEKLWKSTQSLN